MAACTIFYFPFIHFCSLSLAHHQNAGMLSHLISIMYLQILQKIKLAGLVKITIDNCICFLFSSPFKCNSILLNELRITDCQIERHAHLTQCYFNLIYLFKIQIIYKHDINDGMIEDLLIL